MSTITTLTGAKLLPETTITDKQQILDYLPREPDPDDEYSGTFEFGTDPSFYIAGPMTGYENFNFEAFHYATYRLRRLGLRVINPAENFGGKQDLSHRTYLRAAYQQVLYAAGVIVLSGWTRSAGARIEVLIAATTGKPVIRYTNGELIEDALDVAQRGVLQAYAEAT